MSCSGIVLSIIAATVFVYESIFPYILQIKKKLVIEYLTTFYSYTVIIIILGTLFCFSSVKLGSLLGNKE